ncbi:MAG: hypothetical protein ACRELT_06650 [Longimicrobiales bacterium]
MRASWIMAIAAGAAIGMTAPTELMAQGNSNRARQQQELQRQRQQAREQARRDAERDRLRRQEQARQRAGVVLRRNDDYDRSRDRRDYDRSRDRRDYDYDRSRDRRDDRYDTRRVFDRRDDRYGSNRGPAFCRSGEGHPVMGRQWCRDKGFGLGREGSRDIWGDIIFRERRYDDRRLDRSTLGDILGSVVLGRFDSYGRGYYGSGSLNGRWLDNRSSVLQLFMGGIPIARLIDTNRDGRVDSVSLTR